MKRIFIDWGAFLHTAGHASKKSGMSSTYTALNMIISCLRRIGIEPEDRIYIAVDFLKSWRKQFVEEYKANRKELRDKSDINWDKEFGAFDELLKALDIGTDWYILKKEHMEADDWMAVGCRYFKDDEVILITFDSDLEQMWHYDNVKIFGMKHKPKRYKVKPKKFNAYKLLSKKTNKEKADNLTSAILSEEDYEARLAVVNLLQLPDFVENPIKEVYDSLEEKEEIYSENIPFVNLREKIENLYNDRKDIVTYDWSVKLEEKRKKRRKK